jgi:hypothetical protein
VWGPSLFSFTLVTNVEIQKGVNQMHALEDLLEPLSKWEAEKIFEELLWEEWHKENDHTGPDYPPSAETSELKRPKRKGQERRNEDDDNA